MSEAEGTHAKKKPKGKPVEFNRAALKSWVTGFAKRKAERRQYGAVQLAKKQRVARNAARKERRDALKITDRLTGAFGEKHKNDSDDELGEEAQNPEDFEAEQQAKKAAAKNRHEDEEAVVTVVTREHDSEEDMSDEDDDSDDDGDAAGSSKRGGIPFRRRDEEDAPRKPQASSTPYNPSGSHQARAVQKAKLAIKAKDKSRKKGISGGHKYKRAKVSSKKKKASGKKGGGKDK